MKLLRFINVTKGIEKRKVGWKNNVKIEHKKIGFALIMQALMLLCSLVTSLVVPKYMGTTQYGYWQIYYFYLNYINFVTLGYNDGLVLKYGGKKRKIFQ